MATVVETAKTVCGERLSFSSTDDPSPEFAKIVLDQRPTSEAQERQYPPKEPRLLEEFFPEFEPRIRVLIGLDNHLSLYYDVD